MLVEANILMTKGRNLKITAEGRWFGDDRRDRYRVSGVYEYLPWAFAQLRLGIRARFSDDDASARNSELGFIQPHVVFWMLRLLGLVWGDQCDSQCDRHSRLVLGV